MHPLMFPILLGASVGLFTWALSRLVFGTDDERRRVSQRLSEDGRNYNVGGSRRSILLKTENSALALALARKSFFQNVQKQLLVAWPSLSLARFVIIASTFAAIVASVLAVCISSRVVPVCVGAAAWYFPFFILSGKAFSQIHQFRPQHRPHGNAKLPGVDRHLPRDAGGIHHRQLLIVILPKRIHILLINRLPIHFHNHVTRDKPQL
jgi:hypothetical protein